MGYQRVWLAASLCLLACVMPSLAGPARREAELKWARRVVQEFLELATGDSPAEATGLLSQELARAIQSDKLRTSFLDVIWAGYRSPKIISEEVAPNGSEIIVHGVLKGKALVDDADITLRVAKESTNGKWSIRMVRLKTRTVRKDK